ncbi:hypothetical protein [Aliihoeflea sp. PC F10.4]
MRTFIVAVAMLTGSSAFACNTDLISVQDDWTAVNSTTADGTVTTTISLSYAYDGDAPFRMIDSTVTFSDALGSLIAVVRIDRDAGLEPGQASKLEITSFGPRLPRLAELERSDVRVDTCTMAIVYVDGTVVEFDEDA